MRPFPIAFPAEPPRGEGWEWFHIILTAYGQWLHGDPRGFRTKHHREHIEGDYQHPPPPGAYEARLHRSKSLMSFPAQVLTGDKRPLVGRALLERYAELGAFVACAAVARKHIHLLVKLPSSQTRQWTGQAKLHAYFVLRAADHGEKLWAKGAKYQPVRNQEHHRNVVRYILRHVQEGAWIWRWTKEGGVASA